MIEVSDHNGEQNSTLKEAAYQLGWAVAESGEVAHVNRVAVENALLRSVWATALDDGERAAKRTFEVATTIAAFTWGLDDGTAMG